MNTQMLARIVQAEASAIAEAGALLRAGKLVAFPTETVYGLGADAGNDKAVAAIFAAKGRPQFNPLIVHVRDLAEAEEFAEFSEQSRKLANAFWPGGLTLVLPRKMNTKLSLLVSAGLDTVALRVPANTIAQQLLAAAECPIAAPSANRSGTVSPTRAEHVGDLANMVLDGGKTKIGVESTIIGFENGKPVLLRPGAIARDEIEAVIGLLEKRSSDTINAPGQLKSHYAPKTKIRLNAKDVQSNEALLAFGPPLSGARITRNLSENGDVNEAAANLFSMMRELDAAGADCIAVMPVPETGLGEAINDRLRRAAA